MPKSSAPFMFAPLAVGTSPPWAVEVPGTAAAVAATDRAARRTAAAFVCQNIVVSACLKVTLFSPMKIPSFVLLILNVCSDLQDSKGRYFTSRQSNAHLNRYSKDDRLSITWKVGFLIIFFRGTFGGAGVCQAEFVLSF